MDCVVKSRSVTFIRAAATLIVQTLHICQICALWKFLSSRFSILCNYLPSDVITSHSFQLSNPVFAHQQKIAKSASELSDLVFGNFWQQKSRTRTEVVPDWVAGGCISNNRFQFLLQCRHRRVSSCHSNAKRRWEGCECLN